MDILNKKMLQMGNKTVLLLIVLAAGSIVVNAGVNSSTQKQKVIAGAIFKFIKFIEWENPVETGKDEFIMCLQKHDASFDVYTERQVRGKNIKLKLVEDNTSALSCDVLYLNNPASNQSGILSALKDKSILTISEQMGFADQGGIIELGNKNNRLNFSINLLVAKASQLNIGFQLLSLARNVIEK